MKRNSLQPILFICILFCSYYVKVHAQAPGTWAGGAAGGPCPTPNATFSMQNAIGVGIPIPRGWQEIKYTPANGVNQTGLIITNANSNLLLPVFNPGNFDYIGNGTIGQLPEQSQIIVPFSFLTGNLTTVTTPYYQPGMKPLLWARVQNDPLVVGGTFGGIEEYETKMIVLPDGSVGINIADPRAALDVRGSQGDNRPAAIFGSRAMGTGFRGANGLYQYYTQQMHMVPILSDNGYNRISRRNDQGIFFSDGKGTIGSNLNGAFVLAPWSQEGDAAQVGGLRMDKFGNVEIHGALRATRMTVDVKWWSDFVFCPEYELPKLSEVESYIQHNGYLPGMPGEQQMLSGGVEVADMFAMQLRKIEELTLYAIQQEKVILTYEEKLEQLEKRIIQLEQQTK